MTEREGEGEMRVGGQPAGDCERAILRGRGCATALLIRGNLKIFWLISAFYACTMGFNCLLEYLSYALEVENFCT